MVTMNEKNTLIKECISYQTDIYNFIFRMTYDSYLSEDITQETFILAFRNITQFSSKSSLKTWLLTIAKNEVYRNKKLTIRNIKKLYEIREIENTKKVIDAFTKYEKDFYVEQIKNGCLFALLTCLPINQRCAFILYILSDISIESISEILNKTQNSIRILISRAKKTISNFLCNNCEHITNNPNCKCLNMYNFSMQNNLLSSIKDHDSIENAKIQIRKFNSEIDLIKTLPFNEIQKKLFTGSDYSIIFQEKVK